MQTSSAIRTLILCTLILQSQCSSQERLHQIPGNCPTTVPIEEKVKILAQHFSSNESNPSLEEEGHRSPLLRPRSRSLRYALRRLWSSVSKGAVFRERPNLSESSNSSSI